MADRKRHDVIVRNLLDALDRIVNVAAKPHQQPYIMGLAEQAIKNAEAQMVRDDDGYLVVKE